MIAKFKTFNQLLSVIDNEVNKQKEEIEWYKFKIQQIANRKVPNATF